MTGTTIDDLPDAERLKPEQVADLRAGRIASFDREGGGFRMMKRLRDSSRVVAIDFPGPDSRRVKMVTYAVNWAIEFAIVAVLVFFWVRPFWRDLRRLPQALSRRRRQDHAVYLQGRSAVGAERRAVARPTKRI